MQYLQNTPHGLLLKTAQNETVKPTSLNRYLGARLIQEKTTVNGRLHATKKWLKIHRNPPLYITDGLCLFPTHNRKHPDNIFINAHAVFQFRALEAETTQVVFTDLSHLIVKRRASLLARRCKQALDLSNAFRLKTF